MKENTNAVTENNQPPESQDQEAHTEMSKLLNTSTKTVERPNIAQE